MGVLLVFAGSTFAALTQFNRFATSSRLRVHALALAQQRIDEVLTTQWRGNAARPPILAVGTRIEDDLVMNADTFNTQTGLGSIFTALAAPVRGTRRIEVTNITTRTLRATVRVTFVYASRNYTVELSTMRSTDTI